MTIEDVINPQHLPPKRTMNHKKRSCNCIQLQEPEEGCFYKNKEVACVLKFSYEIADFLAGTEVTTNATEHVKKQLAQQSKRRCDCRKQTDKALERGKRCYEKWKEKVIECYQKHPMETMHCAPSVRDFKRCVEDIKECIKKSYQ